MSAQHKAALAQGREEGRIVRRYLEALESATPRRGRRRTPATVQRKLVEIDAKLPTADPLARLHLVQEQHDLEAELASSASTEDISALEQAFVQVAKTYGERKGISYSAWRSVGVAASVLQQAGIPRTRG